MQHVLDVIKSTEQPGYELKIKMGCTFTIYKHSIYFFAFKSHQNDM